MSAETAGPETLGHLSEEPKGEDPGSSKAKAITGKSPMRIAMGRLLRDKIALVCSAVVLFFVVIVLTLFNKERAVVQMPVTDVYAKATDGPKFIHNIRLWILIAVAMILFSYGPYFFGYLFDPNFVSPPFRLW